VWVRFSTGPCSFYTFRQDPAFNRTCTIGSPSSGEIAAAPLAQESRGESIVICRCEEVRLETGPTALAATPYSFGSGRSVRTDTFIETNARRTEVHRADTWSVTQPGPRGTVTCQSYLLAAGV
jgi:hypothetical protein